MFCSNTSLYSRDFADTFLIRMLDFLWSVFSENCKVRLGFRFKKYSFPDLFWDYLVFQTKKPYNIAFLLTHTLARLPDSISSSMMLDHFNVKWPCSSLACKVWDYITPKSNYTEGSLQTCGPSSVIRISHCLSPHILVFSNCLLSTQPLLNDHLKAISFH